MYTIKIDLDLSLLKQLDAFDLNGKDLHTRGIQKISEMCSAFAERSISQLLAAAIPIILCNTDLYTVFFIAHARM